MPLAEEGERRGEKRMKVNNIKKIFYTDHGHGHENEMALSPFGY